VVFIYLFIYVVSSYVKKVMSSDIFHKMIKLLVHGAEECSCGMFQSLVMLLREWHHSFHMPLTEWHVSQCACTCHWWSGMFPSVVSVHMPLTDWWKLQGNLCSSTDSDLAPPHTNQKHYSLIILLIFILKIDANCLDPPTRPHSFITQKTTCLKSSVLYLSVHRWEM
jgi:hypothetical protein